MTRKRLIRARKGDIGFATTLPASLINTLRAEARQRRVQQKQIVLSALEAFFHPEGQDSRDAMIGRRLNRIDARQRALAQQHEIIAETLALFVRVWLTNTTEVPDSQKSEANAQGGKRYQRFIEHLVKRLGAGQSLFTELPKEVLLTASDFEPAASSETPGTEQQSGE